jgi:cell division protein FtsI/penicillin-binding protein 2
VNQFRIRLLFLSIILGAGAVLVAARLFSVQVLEYKRYEARSRDQTQKRKIVVAKRGTIRDRNGNALAVSMDAPIDVKSEMLGVATKKADKAAVKRVYPLGDIAGSVLGYVGRDGYGLGGVELSFDKYLRGEDGWEIQKKDGRNHQYKKIGLPSREPRDGFDCYLTIDNNIQKIVQTVLKQTVESSKAIGGMCVVMDPSTGKILAMANEPNFNPNVPSVYSLTQRQNSCISSVYEPGSTFKLVTSSIAIEENVFKEDDILYGNNGSFEIYNQVIRDHSPYGYLTFAKALAVSSNVCFAKISNEIGNDRMYRYTRDFGFGCKTGLSLPGEEVGIVHSIKDWSGRTRVTMAMGQELSVTLLQMASAFSVVANKGVLLEPQICEKIVDTKGNDVVTFDVKPVRKVISEESAHRVAKMLQKVVSEGTGKNAAIEGIDVAGKTGTSQKPDSGSYSKIRGWSSFIGFVPVENPMLLCAVVIDEPAGGEMGGVVAAPAFRKIMQQVITHPELEYAGKCIKQNSAPAVQPDSSGKVQLPVICGKSKDSAVTLLTEMSVKYRVEGPGNTVIRQYPKAGAVMQLNDTVTIYCENAPTAGSAVTSIPDFTGMDLRDAIKLMGVEGLKPFAVGSGVVRRQKPLSGTSIRPAEVCTLYCSFDG